MAAAPREHDIRPWPRGNCEAGDPTGPPQIRKLGYCDRKARWMVDYTLLCGTCKRKIVGAAVGSKP